MAAKVVLFRAGFGSTPTTASDADTEQFTDLHRAAYEGNVTEMRRLLEKGEQPNAITHSLHLTPLHMAAASGHAAAVAELLNAPGIDATAPDNDAEGFTPPHAAAKCGQLEVLRLFLDDPKAAISANFATSAGTSLLHAGAASADGPSALAICTLLVDRGATLNVLDRVGLSPLHEAAKSANVALVKYFLAHGADPNLREQTPPSGSMEAEDVVPVGVTALHLAVYNADTRDAVACVEALCAARADVTLADDLGITALHAAVSRPRTADLPDAKPQVIADILEYREAIVAFMVSALLRHGASPNAKDIRGDTPLAFAASNGWGEAVFQLLEKGANPLVKNYAGKTVADAAAAANEVELAKILRAV